MKYEKLIFVCASNFSDTKACTRAQDTWSKSLLKCRRILNTTPCRPTTKSIPTTMTNTRHLQADEILLRIEKSTVKTTMFLNSYFKSISLHYSNGSRLQYHIQYVQSRSCSPVSYFSYSVARGGEGWIKRKTKKKKHDESLRIRLLRQASYSYMYVTMPWWGIRSYSGKKSNSISSDRTPATGCTQIPWSYEWLLADTVWCT